MGIHYDYKSTKGNKLMEKQAKRERKLAEKKAKRLACLLYTSPSPRDRQKSRMPSSA